MMNTQTKINTLKSEQAQTIAEATATKEEAINRHDGRSLYGRFAFSSVLGE